MFDAYLAAPWVITCYKNKAMYFLVDCQDGYAFILWTRRKEKSMRFSTQNEALAFAQDIKSKRDQKWLDFGVKQVYP